MVGGVKCVEGGVEVCLGGWGGGAGEQDGLGAFP